MSNHEGQAASTGASRVNVLRLSGPCERWARDADFIREILDLVGDKWSMLVTRALADGDARYSDLDTEIPAISRRMLTLTLKRLERSGLVDRTAHAEVPPRVVYSLTSLGASLVSAVEHLAAWCVEQHAEIRRHQDAYDKSATRIGP
ncbi:helix-turn-helix domain-containing protein [Streptomyces mirabilis]|uniref:winged helix-turn-helix transcriptional regulator n=1 Tax=Streptomyces mirabilis TaxID=68239 RepID=UPI00331FD557